MMLNAQVTTYIHHPPSPAYQNEKRGVMSYVSSNCSIPGVVQQVYYILLKMMVLAFFMLLSFFFLTLHLGVSKIVQRSSSGSPRNVDSRQL